MARRQGNMQVPQSNGITCILAVVTCWLLSSLCWAHALVILQQGHVQIRILRILIYRRKCRGLGAQNVQGA